jgi:hypothetical protein
MVSSVSLWGQTAEAPGSRGVVTLAVNPIEGDTVYVEPDADAAAKPFIENILTVIGENVSGLPCYNCVANALSPNLGILTPAGVIQRGGNTYQIDTFLYDQNYTGSCTFTIEIVDAAKTVVASTNSTFSFTAPTTILLNTTLAIPSTAGVGVGHVQTRAVCGASTTYSASNVYIAR